MCVRVCVKMQACVFVWMYGIPADARITSIHASAYTEHMFKHTHRRVYTHTGKHLADVEQRCWLVWRPMNSLLHDPCQLERHAACILHRASCMRVCVCARTRGRKQARDLCHFAAEVLVILCNMFSFILPASAYVSIYVCIYSTHEYLHACVAEYQKVLCGLNM